MADDALNNIEVQKYTLDALIAQYDRYVLIASYSTKVEVLSFQEYISRILLLGMVSYEANLASCEISLKQGKRPE